MSETDKPTAQELRRRIAVYDDLETSGNWQGRMSSADYLGLLFLTVVLVGGFWIWGH
jgi:hypothetical protein